MRNPFAITASTAEGGAAAADAGSGPKPSIPYWYLWTDENGVSHQKQCALTAFEMKGVGGAAPQWNNKHERLPSTVVVTVQSVGWVGDWHENPPQRIVVLSGRWWIESMDGTRIEQGAGEFSFGVDQGGRQGADGRKGTPLGHHRRPARRVDDGATPSRAAP